MVKSWAQSIQLGAPRVFRQPVTRQVIAGEPPVIAYTDAVATQTFNATLGGVAVSVMVRPVFYRWDWSDGDHDTTFRPGAPYPKETITHAYDPAPRRQIGLTVTYEPYLSVGGGSYQVLPFMLKTTGVSTPFEVIKVGIVLTDDAEKAQGH
ncbi:MAG: hypothetical protein Q4A71_06620 [Actinomycetaceae bacterium]|nr:hypothetical protein [Actinomycetaceae bacterium]